jgi:hypothetical protein
LFSGDGGHVHHVLVHHKGLSIRKTVVVLALVQVVFSGIAVVSRIRLGWWAVVPAVALLLVAIVLIRWVDYVEFRVLWRHFIRDLFRSRRRSLASSVLLAKAGHRIRGAGTADELSRALGNVRADLDLAFLALEFTEDGRRIAEACAAPLPTGGASARRYFAGREGASCWVFSGDASPFDPEETSYIQTIEHQVRGEDGKVFAHLVCQRLGVGGSISLKPEDIRRYVVWPLRQVLQRLGPAEEADMVPAGQTENANS